jgi:SAM-dependent methyltransferase
MNLSSQRFDTIAFNYVTSEVHGVSPTIARLHEVLGDERFESVLDVACGAGHFGLSFSGRAEHLTAVDPSPRMRDAVRALAEERQLTVDTVDARAEALPFPDGTFDVTLCRLAAHHFTDIAKAISEMNRVTRPGGPIAIIDLQGSDDPVADALNHEIELLHDPTHVRSYRESDWKKSLVGSGLSFELHSGQMEFPNGLSVARWCEISVSGAEAEAKIRSLLKGASPTTLSAIGIHTHDDEYYLSIRSILIIARKPL